MTILIVKSHAMNWILTIPITGLPPLQMPFCVATVISNSVENRSAAEMMYSKVASYTGLQLSFTTIVLRFVSLARPGSKYNLTYGSGMLDASLIGILLNRKRERSALFVIYELKLSHSLLTQCDG